MIAVIIIGKWKLKNLEGKPLYQNFAQAALAMNHVLRGEKTANNRLSHGRMYC
jgi:hypothetical protein